MKKILLLSSLLALTVLLSACGGSAAAPTISPQDVQSTAIAAAFTLVAQTQAAIPTTTPQPTATNTPIPTDTPVPSPTSAILSLPTSLPTETAASGGGDCAHPLDLGAAGPGHPTRIKNQSGGAITLSLNLYPPNAFGGCGAISYQMAKNGSVTAQLPAGNWYAYAWITLKDKQTTASLSFFVQPAQFDKLELCIRKENIVYSPSC